MIRYVVPVLYGMLQLITLFVIGFILRRRNVFSSDFFKDLSRLGTRVALPLYYFARLSSADIGALKSAFMFPLAAILLTTVGLSLSYGAMKALRFQGNTLRAGMVLGAFGNSGFLPLFMVEMFPLSVPVVAELFGVETPLVYLSAFTLAQSPLVWSVGNYLISGRLGKPRIRDFINPPIIGILAGITVALLHVEPYLQDRLLPFFHIASAIEQFGVVFFPLVIITLGAIIADLGTISFKSKRHLYLLASAAGCIRLLVFPLLFILLYFTVLHPLNFSRAQIWVIFLQMHIPPGTIFTMMAIQADINREETAFTVMVTYLLYLILLPVYILTLFSLPGILT